MNKSSIINVIKILIIIFLGLIFPFFGIIAFISQELTPISNILSIICYFVFWVGPILNYYDKKVKLFYLKIILLNILIYIGVLYVGQKEVDKIQIPRAHLRIDESNVSNSSSIIDFLEHNKNYNFVDLESLNKLYGMDFEPVVDCYYLKGINNNTGFVFAYKYKSEENAKKNGNEYFIYKKPENYILSNEEGNEMIKVTNTYCFDK